MLGCAVGQVNEAAIMPSEKELRAVATQVLEGAVSPGPDSSRYAFSKRISDRNLYRIPLQ